MQDLGRKSEFDAFVRRNTAAVLGIEYVFFEVVLSVSGLQVLNEVMERELVLKTRELRIFVQCVREIVAVVLAFKHGESSFDLSLVSLCFKSVPAFGPQKVRDWTACRSKWRHGAH